MGTSEIRPLTGLRGVAAVIVMFYHYFLWTGLDFHKGYLGVDLFLVLSGFILSATYHVAFTQDVTTSNYFDFLRRRTARVYPLYLVTTVVALIMISAGVKDRMTGDTSSFPTFAISNLLMVQNWGLAKGANPPTWSISAEFACYLIFPWLALALGRAKPWHLLLVIYGMLFVQIWLTGCTGFFHVVKYEGPLDLSEPTRFGAVIRSAADFCIGTSLFFTGQWRRTCALSTAIFGVFLIFLREYDVSAIALIPSVILGASTNNGPLRFLGRGFLYTLGEISYSIYLIHDFFVELRNPTFHWLKAHGIPGALIIYAAVFAAVSIFLSILSYKWIEAPFRRWINSSMTNWKSAPSAQFNR